MSYCRFLPGEEKFQKGQLELKLQMKPAHSVNILKSSFAEAIFSSSCSTPSFIFKKKTI